MCVSETALFVFYEFIDWFFVGNDKINTYNVYNVLFIEIYLGTKYI